MGTLQFIFIFILGIVGPDLNKEAIDLYIDQHKGIAITEMNRTGIPASIKLAQGLLESKYGSSSLAQSANNHFGIKCGGNWKGGEYYLEDDDYKNGKLIQSCFRKYGSSFESYIAHSDFLKDDRKKHRYGFLFKYDRTDYESWAYGLLDAGYATDRKYPQKLISIIEKYQLYQYDKDGASYVDINKYRSTKNKEQNKEVDINQNIEVEDQMVHTTRSNSNSKASKYRTKKINEVRVFVANQSETVLDFSRKNNLKVSDIIKYNERINSSADMVIDGDYVYVEEKKRNFNGYKKEHRVKDGEDIYSIAQKYGIRLKSLYAKNRLPLDSEILPGQTLSLKGKVKLGDRPDFILNDKIETKEKSKFLF